MILLNRVILANYERLRARYREASRQTEYLFQSLLHRAFASWVLA